MGTPKILFFGDNHSHFRHIIKAVETEKPDAIILLGDIEPQRPLEVELAPILGKTIIRFIHGNHDTDTDFNVRNVFESKLAHCNLDGRVEDICGVRIAGLGGIFRGKVWYPPDAPTFASYADWLEASRRSLAPGTFDQVHATAARTHRSSATSTTGYHCFKRTCWLRTRHRRATNMASRRSTTWHARSACNAASTVITTTA